VIISAEPKIFTLINAFTVEPDNADAVVASLRGVTEILMRTLPGFIGASTHKSADGRHVANYV
jgi:antibiotic biosynthesis monooxygenase (ABM) superfamily enzyme